MATDSHSRPSTNWGRSSRPYASQRDMYDYDCSPPRTPTRHQSKGATAGARELKVPQQRETFFDDLTPTDPPRWSESGDERDPHDLALSPRHVTRTSIVDNMLLSLDQFGSDTPGIDQSSSFFGASADAAGYAATARYIAKSRHRGHTFSSSVSSERDAFLSEQGNYYPKKGTQAYAASQAPPASRRLDGTHTSHGQNTRGRANGDYSRSHRDHTTHQESKDSTSSSVDYGQNHSSRRHSQSGRRSASLDQLTGGLVLQNALGGDDIDAAPTPNVPAGPRREISHDPSVLAQFPPPPRTPGMSRRNSTKSAKSISTRKGRSDTLGTATQRGHRDDLPPPLPPPYIEPSAPSPTISYQKPPFPPPEPTPVKERPGFFRRVFGGSSKNLSSPSGSYDSRGISAPTIPVYPDYNGQLSGDRKQSKRPTTTTNTNTTQAPLASQNEIHHPPTKKASFFRRRKKSVSSNVPPPLNLQVSNLRVLDQLQAETSPATSLRKVMDPFLLADADYDRADFATHDTDEELPNDPTPVAKRTERWNDSNHAALDLPTQRPAIPEKSPSRNIRGLQLSIPNAHDPDDSFLADSSENENSNIKSGRRDHSSPMSGDANRRPRTSPDPRRRLPAADDDARHSGSNDKSSGGVTPRAADSKAGTFLTVTDSSRDLLAGEAMPRRSSNDRLDPNSSTEQLDSSRGASSPKTSGVDSPRGSNSDVSYHTASNTPLTETVPALENQQSSSRKDLESVATNDAEPSSVDVPSSLERDIAKKMFENAEEVAGDDPAAAWLGSPERALIRQAYMELFDWRNLDILASLRGLCSKLVLKGETQQVDRVLDAFSTRWCECNPKHGFKAVDVVHTICYSLLLLNTDLHVADIEQKMSRTQFIRNTMPTISRVASDAAPNAFDTNRSTATKPRSHLKPGDTPSGPPTPSQTQFSNEGGDGAEELRAQNRASRVPSQSGVTPAQRTPVAGPLVDTPHQGSIKAWELQIENILKDFYNSIQRQRLPLHGSQPESQNLTVSTSTFGSSLRRSPSTISKAGSEIVTRGRTADSKLSAGRWSSKPRSRPRLYPASNVGSSRTSLDDQSSVWSPSGSSTWSKYSLGKTGTSMSLDTLGSDYPRGDYQQSIGFANALSHAIIRDDSAQSITSLEDVRSDNLLDDETLELAGAPWAKEGSLKHKQHLDAVDKRSKDRNWNECFAVIQRGWMRLFSFNASTKSMRLKAKQRQNVVVGGGNWMENAEEVWKFLLRHTIANPLPAPGYSKSRPHVWALSLPNGAVHLFQVGTAEIVKEFVSTANYWSARLSKEPLLGGISNMEYGWGDAVINCAALSGDARSPPPSSGAPRSSMQSSIRSSIDQQVVRAKLPADRLFISDWTPPQQTMMASPLSEADQLKSLQTYVNNVEAELQRHHELRQAITLAFTPRHANATKAMSNWSRKSSFLLREIVKFRTYIDCLQAAQAQREKIHASREEQSENRELPSESIPLTTE